VKFKEHQKEKKEDNDPSKGGHVEKDRRTWSHSAALRCSGRANQGAERKTRGATRSDFQRCMAKSDHLATTFECCTASPPDGEDAAQTAAKWAP
jgi:hypothetical protein